MERNEVLELLEKYYGLNLTKKANEESKEDVPNEEESVKEEQTNEMEETKESNEKQVENEELVKGSNIYFNDEKELIAYLLKQAFINYKPLRESFEVLKKKGSENPILSFSLLSDAYSLIDENDSILNISENIKKAVDILSGNIQDETTQLISFLKHFYGPADLSYEISKEMFHNWYSVEHQEESDEIIKTAFMKPDIILGIPTQIKTAAPDTPETPKEPTTPETPKEPTPESEPDIPETPEKPVPEPAPKDPTPYVKSVLEIAFKDFDKNDFKDDDKIEGAIKKIITHDPKFEDNYRDHAFKVLTAKKAEGGFGLDEKTANKILDKLTLADDLQEKTMATKALEKASVKFSIFKDAIKTYKETGDYNKSLDVLKEKVNAVIGNVENIYGSVEPGHKDTILNEFIKEYNNFLGPSAVTPNEKLLAYKEGLSNIISNVATFTEGHEIPLAIGAVALGAYALHKVKQKKKKETLEMLIKEE